MEKKNLSTDDLIFIAKFLEGATPLTEEEIANFGVMPKGATVYPDYESFKIARKELEKVHHQTFCSLDEGIFWTLEL